nr:MAG TPA: helix-turn-helix domain protein [Caudoviricetes sp.]
MKSRRSKAVTQNEQVLKHLLTYEKITSLEAIELYGIMRLGARIYDLKKQGYPIKTYLRVGKSRNGESMVFAEYRLERVEEARRRWRS